MGQNSNTCLNCSLLITLLISCVIIIYSRSHFKAPFDKENDVRFFSTFDSNVKDIISKLNKTDNCLMYKDAINNITLFFLDRETQLNASRNS